MAQSDLTRVVEPACKKLAEQIKAGFECGGDGEKYSVKLTLTTK